MKANRWSQWQHMVQGCVSEVWDNGERCEIQKDLEAGGERKRQPLLMDRLSTGTKPMLGGSIIWRCFILGSSSLSEPVPAFLQNQKVLSTSAGSTIWAKGGLTSGRAPAQPGWRIILVHTIGAAFEWFSGTSELHLSHTGFWTLITLYATSINY